MTVTPTNQSKDLVSPTDTSKNSVTATNLVRPGSSWTYDQVGITYDGPNDSVSGFVIYYDSIGSPASITNQTKS